MDFEGESAIQSCVRRAAEAQRDATERLIEVMLTTPNSPGISVRTEMKEWSITSVAQLDPDVPFGEIRHHPMVVT